MTDPILHEATYPHSPETVWRALTTPEALGAWLMPTTFREPVVGHRFQFRDKPRKIVGWDGVTDCEVLEADAPRRLVIAFGTGQPGEPPTRVTWDLAPTPDGGTHVRFRHEGFTGFRGWLMRQGMNQGWGGMVRHSIPFVMEGLLRGAVPTREATTAARKQGFRADHAARRAESTPRA